MLKLIQMGKNSVFGVRVPLSYKATFYQIDAFLYSFIPLSVMFTANCLIILKFIIAKCKNRHGCTESVNQALSKSAVKGTVMLLTVICFCDSNWSYLYSLFHQRSPTTIAWSHSNFTLSESQYKWSLVLYHWIKVQTGTNRFILLLWNKENYDQQHGKNKHNLYYFCCTKSSNMIQQRERSDSPWSAL